MKTTVNYLKINPYHFLAFVSTFFLFSSPRQIHAQQLVLDPGYNVQAGLNDVVWASQIQSDGKIVAGGDFTSYNSSPINRIIRLNTNGTLDNSFSVGQGFNSTVWAIAIQSDGKIIVGGQFSSYNGMPYNRLIRLNPNGTPDASFTPAAIVNGIVRSILILPDNKILVGGYLSNRIVRLNPNGQQDLSFTFTPLNLTSIVAIARQTDGKILVGGESYNRIYRLHVNGNVDFSYNPVLNGTVRTITLQQDGKAIVGGDFTFSTNSGFVTRLDTNGTIDNGFNVGVAANSNIWTTNVLSNGTIVIGGAFTSFNGSTPQRYLVALNSNGSFSNQYTFGNGFSYGSAVGAVLSSNIQSDGKIVAFGQFSTYNSSPSLRIARLSNPCPPPVLNNGLTDTTICSGISKIFTVTANGGGLTYQWFYNNSIIPSANGNSITANSQGVYTVTVTNACGSSVSSTAELKVRQSLTTPSYPSCALSATKICTTSTGERSFNLMWQSGSGNKQLVVVSTSPIGDFPLSGTSYAADAIFGMGDDLGNSTFVVFNGAGNSVYVTNAPSISSRLFFAVFDYNDLCGPPMYLVSSFASGFMRAKDSVSLCSSNVDLTKSNGLNSSSNEGFRIYPNPNNGSFRVQAAGLSPEEKVQYRIVNSTGKVEATGQLTGSDQIIDLSEKSSGVYFIHLSTSRSSTVKKVIVD